MTEITPEEKLREILEENKKLKASLKQFGEIDLNAAKQALEFQKNSEREAAEKRGEFEKILGEQKEQFKNELNSLKEFGKQQLLENQLGKALSKYKGDVSILTPYLLSKNMVKVVDNSGIPVIECEFDGCSCDVDTLVKKMSESEAYDKYFEATGHSGSGTQPVSQSTDVLDGRSQELKEMFTGI